MFGLVTATLTGNLVLSLLVALSLRADGFQSFSIPSGSMVPTLAVGDTVLGDTDPRRFLPLRRGDIVLHEERGSTYVKRLVGLPGDSVEMRSGRLVLDGAVVAREPAGTCRAEGDTGSPVDAPAFREHLPGAAPDIVVEIEPDGGVYGTMAPVRLGPHQYFMLGDNRGNSSDSRDYGPVDESALVGRVVSRVTAMDGLPPLGGPSAAAGCRLGS